ncbi:MAG: hypothetical protein JNN20_00770, partial [Betaproteobacteria bacterium]|nr:hypothetical protein [Betaproteobacteria bacterium]
MNANFRSAVTFAGLLFLAPALALAASTKAPATPEKMSQLYAEYWEENLQANPMLATRIGD